MTAPLLSRRHHRAGPALPVLGDMTLPLARLHELCGTARHSLAMIVAAATQGTVLWIAPDRSPETLNPDGMRAFADPARFLFVTARRPEDMLWTLEEALRSGAVPLAVADLPEPPGLTPVRRLHLAAETGAAVARPPPLGLILTPGTGGAPGIETRWQLTPAHDARRNSWRLDRLRARTAPPQSWALTGQPGAWQLTPPRDDMDLTGT